MSAMNELTPEQIREGIVYVVGRDPVAGDVELTVYDPDDQTKVIHLSLSASWAAQMARALVSDPVACEDRASLPTLGSV